MKLWKATAAMVMALGMALSVAACDDEGGLSSLTSSSSVTTSSSNTTSSVGASEETSESTSEATSESVGDSSLDDSSVVTNPLGEKFMGTIEKSLNEAKSFKMTYEFKVDIKEDVDNPSNHDEYIQAKMPVTVSFEEGGANIHAEVIQVTEDKTEIKQADVYLVDGYMYVSYRDYDYETDTYAMSPYYKVKEDLAGTLGELQNMLNKQVPVMPEIMEIADELLTKLENADLDLPTWDDVKAELINTFTIDGNVMKFTVDAVPAIEATLDAIIEYNTDRTIEAVIDEALLEIVPAGAGETQLTMDIMLDEMATWGAVTLEELWLEMDDFLETEYDTDIQTVYNTVVNDSTFAKTIVLATGDPDAATDLQAMTDLYTAFFGAEGAYKDVTVDVMVDMVIGMMSAESAPNGNASAPSSVEEEPVTMEMVAEMLREELSATKLNEIPAIVEVQEGAKETKEQLTFDKLGMEIGAEFEGEGENLTLKDLYYTFDVDATLIIKEYEWVDEVKTYIGSHTSANVVSMQYAWSDFSTNTVAIALPTGATTVEVWFCENCGDTVMGNETLCTTCRAMQNAPDMGVVAEQVVAENQTLETQGVVAIQFTVEEAGNFVATVDTGNVWICFADYNGVWLTNGCGGDNTYYATDPAWLEAGTYYVIVEDNSGIADSIVNITIDRV